MAHYRWHIYLAVNVPLFLSKRGYLGGNETKKISFLINRTFNYYFNMLPPYSIVLKMGPYKGNKMVDSEQDLKGERAKYRQHVI